MRSSAAEGRSSGRRDAVAYVVPAYPRLSETFVTSELHRVEQAGVDVRLFQLFRVEDRERGPRQPVVSKVRARPRRLPQSTDIESESAWRWLRTNGRLFAPALRSMLARRPLGVARAALLALGEAFQDRPRWWSPPHKVVLKQLLMGIALADAIVREGDIGHIHAHFAHKPTSITWLASTVTGLPFSFTGHARDIYDPASTTPRQLRRKLLAAKFAVTCTEANVRHLRAIAPEATIHRVYHGLGADTVGLLDVVRSARRPHDRLRILAVGRLVRKKGFDVLVEACGLLVQRGVEFEATIAGPDGDHGAEVRARVAALGLADRVRLPGPVGQVELCAEYPRADVFCLPCRVLDTNDRDGIPNVLVEAMASGVPVVTTGISGIPELVTDGDNGVLVAPDDPVALADALARIAAARQDADELGRRGQETVRRRFDGRRSAERLAALLRETVAA